MKETLNEFMKVVIDKELEQLVLKGGANANVESLNETFLKEASPDSYESVIEACKLIYDLDPSENGSKKALDLLTDIKNKSYSISLKVRVLY